MLTEWGQVAMEQRWKSTKYMWLDSRMYGGFSPSMLIFSILYSCPIMLRPHRARRMAVKTFLCRRGGLAVS